MLSYSKISQLFAYVNSGIELAGPEFSLKGCAYAWAIATGKFKPGDRVLDVGGGVSRISGYIHERFGCECWVLDAFHEGGLPTVGKTEHGANPSVRYVLSNAGDYSNEMPNNYFDVVYSVSVLEHVPLERMRDVFMDMIRVTKPGGLLLHNLEICIQNYKLLPHPEWLRKFGRRIFRRVPFHLNSPDLLTVSSWRHFLRSLPSVTFLQQPDRFNELSMFLNPDTLYEPPSNFYNNPPVGSKEYKRIVSINFALIKEY